MASHRPHYLPSCNEQCNNILQLSGELCGACMSIFHLALTQTHNSETYLCYVRYKHTHRNSNNSCSSNGFDITYKIMSMCNRHLLYTYYLKHLPMSSGRALEVQHLECPSSLLHLHFWRCALLLHISVCTESGLPLYFNYTSAGSGKEAFQNEV